MSDQNYPILRAKSKRVTTVTQKFEGGKPVVDQRVDFQSTERNGRVQGTVTVTDELQGQSKKYRLKMKRQPRATRLPVHGDGNGRGNAGWMRAASLESKDIESELERSSAN